MTTENNLESGVTSKLIKTLSVTWRIQSWFEHVSLYLDPRPKNPFEKETLIYNFKWLHFKESKTKYLYQSDECSVVKTAVIVDKLESKDLKN